MALNFLDSFQVHAMFCSALFMAQISSKKPACDRRFPVQLLWNWDCNSVVLDVARHSEWKGIVTSHWEVKRNHESHLILKLQQKHTSTWEKSRKLLGDQVQGYQARCCEKGITLKGKLVKAKKKHRKKKNNHRMEQSHEAKGRTESWARCEMQNPTEIGNTKKKPPKNKKPQKHCRNWLCSRNGRNQSYKYIRGGQNLQGLHAAPK